jgi:hypothetical protein
MGSTVKNSGSSGGVAQVVECLPSKGEALSSKQYCQKKKERKKKEGSSNPSSVSYVS